MDVNSVLKEITNRKGWVEGELACVVEEKNVLIVEGDLSTEIPKGARIIDARVNLGSRSLKLKIDYGGRKMEVIDRKFKFVATNPCKGSVYTEENAIVFLAKDKAVPEMLSFYSGICKSLGCGEEHLESIRLLRERVNDFQATVECRVPDTDTPCEIDRCIGWIL